MPDAVTSLRETPEGNAQAVNHRHEDLAHSSVVVSLERPAKGDTKWYQVRVRDLISPNLKRAYKRWRRFAILLVDFSYDFRRFARHSGICGGHRNREALIAEITKYCHMIEKGLALPNPRPGFGEGAVKELSAKVTYAIQLGMSDGQLSQALDALASYCDFNEKMRLSSPSWLTDVLELGRTKSLLSGSMAIKNSVSYSPETAEAYLSFIGSRHSVRQFRSADIPDVILENAVKAGQSAPCVCNRQACSVYFFRDAAEKVRILSHQNGNRGFGQDAAVVALITVNLRNFLEPGERYQCWIDGGLFAMNFLLGLHAQGVGACCLNWSASAGQDRKLRSLGIIKQQENLVMMVAIGAVRDGAVVARSERKPLAEVAFLPPVKGAPT